MKLPFSRKTRSTLWYWVCLRMSLLALGVVFSITFGMWLRFAIWDYTTTQQILRR